MANSEEDPLDHYPLYEDGVLNRYPIYGYDILENQDIGIEIVRKTHEEARTVLDHQTQLLDDIDDKAARTVRITILLVGAILGVATFGEQAAVSFTNSYILWGSIYLISSIALGMKTYNVSDPYLGPNPRDMNDLMKEETEKEMLLFLVEEGYHDWISGMDFLNRKNGLYLDLTQVSLILGIIFLMMGVVDQMLIENLFSGLSGYLEQYRNSLWPGLPLVAIFLCTCGISAYSIWWELQT